MFNLLFFADFCLNRPRFVESLGILSRRCISYEEFLSLFKSLLRDLSSFVAGFRSSRVFCLLSDKESNSWCVLQNDWYLPNNHKLRVGVVFRLGVVLPKTLRNQLWAHTFSGTFLLVYSTAMQCDPSGLLLSGSRTPHWSRFKGWGSWGQESQSLETGRSRRKCWT